MSVTYKAFIIDEPISNITYSEDYGYYVSTINIKEILKKYVDESREDFDHIFVAYKLGEELHREKIKTGDWIGLGGMVYMRDIGFSNIRIPNENATTLYTYSQYNTFPEEVFVHEFLHNLERIEKEYSVSIPELHDHNKYGYNDDNVKGLKDWYVDYCTSKIGNGLGLEKRVYSIKPIHKSCFQNSVDLTKDFFDEPENIIEELKHLIETIKDNINSYQEGEKKFNGSITI